MHISIQLLLLFIQCLKTQRKTQRQISIQLLLLFIVILSALFKYWLNFNTTLVTVYRVNTAGKTLVALFQYNSCYCLSEFIFDALEARKDFNTTLVTVYQRSRIGCMCPSVNFNTTLVTVYPSLLRCSVTLLPFQYNSCYCLSLGFVLIYATFKRFQYNSCYCLSLIGIAGELCPD